MDRITALFALSLLIGACATAPRAPATTAASPSAAAPVPASPPQRTPAMPHAAPARPAPPPVPPVTLGLSFKKPKTWTEIPVTKEDGARVLLKLRHEMTDAIYAIQTVPRTPGTDVRIVAARLRLQANRNYGEVSDISFGVDGRSASFFFGPAGSVAGRGQAFVLCEASDDSAFCVMSQAMWPLEHQDGILPQVIAMNGTISYTVKLNVPLPAPRAAPPQNR